MNASDKSPRATPPPAAPIGWRRRSHIVGRRSATRNSCRGVAPHRQLASPPPPPQPSNTRRRAASSHYAFNRTQLNDAQLSRSHSSHATKNTPHIECSERRARASHGRKRLSRRCRLRAAVWTGRSDDDVARQSLKVDERQNESCAVCNWLAAQKGFMSVVLLRSTVYRAIIIDA